MSLPKPKQKNEGRKPDPTPGLSSQDQLRHEQRGMEIFLQQTHDFRLALALHNDPVERDQYIRTLADLLAPRNIQVLVLDLLTASQEHTLLGRVKELLKQAAPDKRPAIMVVNLETRVDYTPELHLPGSPGTDFLNTANLHRDLFTQACPAPLVIWMTELLERAFVTQATDLWHWRSHLFDLRTRTRPSTPPISPEGKPWSSDDHRLHPEDRLAKLEEELTAYRTTGSIPDQIRVLNDIGIARLDSGQARLALSDFEEVLRLARQIGDRRGEGNALNNLGLAHADLGDARKAIEFYEQDLVIARETGDRRGEGQTLGNLGNAHRYLGDARKAIEFYEQALVITRETGDRRGEGATLGNLGLAHAALGDARKAIDFYEQDLVIARETGDRRGEGQTLNNLGLAHADLGDAHKAIEFIEQRLVIAREIGDRRGVGSALGNLGNAHAALGDARKALAFYEQRLVIARETGDRRGEGHGLWNTALACHSLGQTEEAIQRAEAALKIREAIEDPNAEMVRQALAEWKGEASD